MRCSRSSASAAAASHGDASQPADVAAIKEVLKTFLDNGGKVVDVLHGGPAAEQGARTAAGARDSGQVLLDDALEPRAPAQPGSGAPPKPDPAAVRAAMEEKLARFKVSKIDLVMVGSGADCRRTSPS